MSQPLLEVNNLSVKYHEHSAAAVQNVSFALDKGGSLGIIGESGSGKTSLALAIIGLLGNDVSVDGEICFAGTDLQKLTERERHKYRWRKAAIVFQNSLEVLNPVLTVHEQIYECIRAHTSLSQREANQRVIEIMELVGLKSTWNTCYPHQLSGGMRQKVLIAMALAADPELLIVDEPTTALDAAAKNEIVELLAKLHSEKKFAMLVISHQLDVAAKLTSKVVVLYAGSIVEEGLTGDVLKNPLHPYTRGLINSSPVLNPYRDLWGIPGEIEDKSGGRAMGCAFYNRCHQRLDLCRQQRPRLQYAAIERKVACSRGGIVTLLQGRGIDKSFHCQNKVITACKQCNIQVRAGEAVALVGRSGSGKTTLARILSGMLQPSRGEVVFEGEKVNGSSATARKNGIQTVFQDPFSATNGQFTVEQAVREPLDILKIQSKEQRKAKVIEALKNVQLPYDEEFLTRKCFALSGGQRQRVALARSLVTEPKLLIADEICSMLDSSTQANILRLLKGLQNKKGFAMLYITHDLSVARKIADMVYVMHQGMIIEYGSPLKVFANPVENYTKELVKEMVEMSI